MNEFTKITLKVKNKIKDKKQGIYCYKGYLFKKSFNGSVRMINRRIRADKLKIYYIEENQWYICKFKNGRVNKKERI